MHSLNYNPESFPKTPAEVMTFRGQDDEGCRLADITFLSKKRTRWHLGGKKHIPVLYVRRARLAEDLSGKGWS